MKFNRKKVNSDKGVEPKAKLAANDSESAGTTVFRPGWNRRSAPAKKVEDEPEKVVKVTSSQNKDDLDRGENVFKSKKKLFIIAGAAVVLVAGIVVAFFMLNGNKEEKLSNSLIKMGRDWYENFYYDGFEESKRADILSRFKDIGIKVDLDNLSRYNTEVNAEIIKEFNPDQEGGCSSTETKIVIKPKDPYGKTDYDIEAILSCKK